MRLVNVFDLYQSTSIIESGLDRVPVSEKEYKRFNATKGDIFFCRSSIKPEGVGWTSYLENEEEPCVFECHLIRARVDSRQVEPAYLSNFLRTDLSRKYVLAHANVTTMATISQGVVESFPVVVPPLDVQRRLVAELDAARAERERALAEAERLLATIDELVLFETGIPTDLTTRKVFSVKRNQLRGPLTPEPHAVIQLEKAVDGERSVVDAGRLIRERITPSKEAPDDLYDWIRIDDLENRPLDVSRIRTELGKDIGGSLIPVCENDVLVARLGPTLLNAKIVLCPASHRQMLASPEFLVLRVSENWNSTFLRWLLRTNYYRTIMYARSRGGTPSRYRLDASDFLTIPLPNISTPKQVEIAAHCGERVREAQNLRSYSETVWREARERFEQQLLQGGKA